MQFEDFNIAKREIIISKSKTIAGEGRIVYVTAATKRRIDFTSYEQPWKEIVKNT